LFLSITKKIVSIKQGFHAANSVNAGTWLQILSQNMQNKLTETRINLSNLFPLEYALKSTYPISLSEVCAAIQTTSSNYVKKVFGQMFFE